MYKKLKTINISLAIIIFMLTMYVQYGMPHGPMINTGYDCVEYNDGRSTACGEQYVEDTRRLNIPGWAKFLRENTTSFFWGFIILFIYFEVKSKNEAEKVS